MASLTASGGASLRAARPATAGHLRQPHPQPRRQPGGTSSDNARQRRPEPWRRARPAPRSFPVTLSDGSHQHRHDHRGRAPTTPPSDSAPGTSATSSKTPCSPPAAPSRITDVDTGEAGFQPANQRSAGTLRQLHPRRQAATGPTPSTTRTRAVQGPRALEKTLSGNLPGLQHLRRHRRASVTMSPSTAPTTAPSPSPTPPAPTKTPPSPSRSSAMTAIRMATRSPSPTPPSTRPRAASS
jgi:hypothetical protein